MAFLPLDLIDFRTLSVPAHLIPDLGIPKNKLQKKFKKRGGILGVLSLAGKLESEYRNRLSNFRENGDYSSTPQRPGRIGLQELLEPWHIHEPFKISTCGFPTDHWTRDGPGPKVLKLGVQAVLQQFVVDVLDMMASRLKSAGRVASMRHARAAIRHCVDRDISEGFCGLTYKIVWAIFESVEIVAPSQTKRVEAGNFPQYFGNRYWSARVFALFAHDDRKWKGRDLKTRQWDRKPFRRLYHRYRQHTVKILDEHAGWLFDRALMMEIEESIHIVPQFDADKFGILRKPKQGEDQDDSVIDRSQWLVACHSSYNKCRDCTRNHVHYQPRRYHGLDSDVESDGENHDPDPDADESTLLASTVPMLDFLRKAQDLKRPGRPGVHLTKEDIQRTEEIYRRRDKFMRPLLWNKDRWQADGRVELGDGVSMYRHILEDGFPLWQPLVDIVEHLDPTRGY